jgi:hypothetical protein
MKKTRSIFEQKTTSTVPAEPKLLFLNDLFLALPPSAFGGKNEDPMTKQDPLVK